MTVVDSDGVAVEEPASIEAAATANYDWQSIHTQFRVCFTVGTQC